MHVLFGLLGGFLGQLVHGESPSDGTCLLGSEVCGHVLLALVEHVQIGTCLLRHCGQHTCNVLAYKPAGSQIKYILAILGAVPVALACCTRSVCSSVRKVWSASVSCVLLCLRSSNDFIEKDSG